MVDSIQDSRFKIRDSRFEIQGLRLRPVLSAFVFALIIFFGWFVVQAQKLAVLTPRHSADDVKFAEKLSDSLTRNFKIIDSSLSAAVFDSENFENPFNLSLAESKNVGAAIGGDFFMLVESASTRRESLNKPEYYESYAVIYLVSARTGKLVFWQLKSLQAAKAETSNKLLFDSVDDLSKTLGEKIKIAAAQEPYEQPKLKLEEVPDENSPEAKNFRAPVPYRRRKPVYPSNASLYNAKATVDVEVDIDADGTILRTEVERWAGFGLEDAVIDNIRQMNWRAAERNGKFLPMRVLLRYNFKKVIDN